MRKAKRLPLTSSDVLAERLQELRRLLPEAFSEDRVDFDRLKAALGGLVDIGRERYNLNWAGKADAIRAIQSLSVGTLKPCREESVDFDTTGNLIIEGDNLEVLKLLQKSYHGKVKMIYIDPPYNTGNEFIYPDNFREGLQDYLRYSGQVNEEGFRTSTNSETDGRFHSKWLSMMYPRLFLARNLLREDGLIFASIDDQEVHNLRLLMNEIFGEENFVAQIVWQNKTGAGARSKGYIALHEYVVCFARGTAPGWDLTGRMSDKIRQTYNKKDEHYEKLGPYATWPLDTTSMDERENLRYPITHEGQAIWPRKQWLWSRERVERAHKENKLVFNRNDKQGTWSVRFKGYLYGEDGKEKAGKPTTLLVGTYTQQGTKDFSALFDRDVFPFPKPVDFIKKLLNVQVAPAIREDDIVLDFFAGSGTTAQAVLELNEEDGGNRKFILVQLPEPTSNPQFPTIAEITRERVRRVIQKLNAADAGKLPLGDGSPPDRGFKAFKLSASNFKIWDGAQAPIEPQGLARQLALFADNLQPGSGPEDILFEILLKVGYDLNAPRKKLTIAGQSVYDVGGGRLMVCLEEQVTREMMRGVIALKPEAVICLDTAFHGSDRLLTNVELEMKSNGIMFQTV